MLFIMSICKKILQLKSKEMKPKYNLIILKAKFIFNKIKWTNNSFSIQKYAVKAIIKIWTKCF